LVSSLCVVWASFAPPLPIAFWQPSWTLSHTGGSVGTVVMVRNGMAAPSTPAGPALPSPRSSSEVALPASLVVNTSPMWVALPSSSVPSAAVTSTLSCSGPLTARVASVMTPSEVVLTTASGAPATLPKSARSMAPLPL